jgi:hypothetical protein
VSVWTFWTWVAIVVLTFGSIAVFAWFLRDLVRIRREVLEEERAVRNGGAEE